MARVPPVILTVPLLTKARLVAVAVLVPAATMSVPPLLKWSGCTQQTDPPTVVPAPIVSVPRLLNVVAPLSSTSPDPCRVVAPCRVSAVGLLVGDVMVLVAFPLIAVVIVLATPRLPSMVPPLHW